MENNTGDRRSSDVANGPRAIVMLENPRERVALGNALKTVGFIAFPCSDATRALQLFRTMSFNLAVIVFEADKHLRLLDSILEFIEARGYQRRPYLWGLSSRINDGNLRYELLSRGAEFCPKADAHDLLRKADAVARAFAHIKRPELRLVHTTSTPYLGRCVAGEIFNKLSIRTPILLTGNSVPLSGKPLLFLDGIFRYSPEDHPLTSTALLRHMEMDPVYLSAIREESLNKRNLITNFYRIKEQGLRPILGSETDECAVSERIAGGEHVYYFKAEIIVKHIEITPPNETV